MARIFYLNIFEQHPARKRNLFQDGYNTRMGIPALAFCETAFSSSKPKGRKVSFEPTNIGEHLRKKRLEQGLLQEDVAIFFGVSIDCIANWEMNRSIPQIQFMPAIIKFLGFNPIEINTATLGGQILQFRYINGLSHKNLGKLIGVNGSSVSSWEKGESIPYLLNLEKLNHLFINN